MNTETATRKPGKELSKPEAGEHTPKQNPESYGEKIMRCPPSPGAAIQDVRSAPNRFSAWSSCGSVPGAPARRAPGWAGLCAQG